MANSILIIAGEVARLAGLGKAFEQWGWDVFRELTAEAGLTTCARTLPGVVLLEERQLGSDGSRLVDAFHGYAGAVILLAEGREVPTGLQTLAEAGRNFLVNSADMAQVKLAANRAAELARLERLNVALSGSGSTLGVDDLLGDAAAMHRLRERIQVLALSAHNAIVVEGEVGSGRSHVARLIHDASARCEAGFLECRPDGPDGVPIEVTLFGVESLSEGEPSRLGLLEVADQGTLLLAEVQRVPSRVQELLAAMLGESTIRRSGGRRQIPLDVRLIFTSLGGSDPAATDGGLGADLERRVATSRIRVPPLRDLPADHRSGALQRMLLTMAPGVHGAPVVLTDAALDRLVSYGWPGNFLEARHVLERALLLARGRPAIGVEHLPGEFRDRSGPFDRRHAPLTIEEVERMHIDRTLKHHGSNRTRTAQELGISRATLIAKIKRYAIGH